ncbi:MAG: tRNA 2-thiouridine(34) synthase MnmA [Planctomycetota bacterium]|nr:MAG: tRNA 2-thiouridine(34) synthase MnmA [Planctomycetota bacterium]
MNSVRVLAALSGGVDSSVAALLLRRQGYDLVGVFLRNGVEAPPGACRPHQGCCSVDDARDAALVADRLGIPFHALDMQAEFGAIQDYFVSEYRRGRTPNPCAVCNRDIKFGALLRFADAVGAAYVATGHYARVQATPQGAALLRSLDRRKDQSYVLFPVGPQALSRTLLPVGGMEKAQTRALAQAANLPVFGKPDSQEICFVPTGDYRDLLRSRGGLGRPGRFLDPDGRVLGEHDGHMGYTRGQRRGLGIAAAAPLYVLDVDAESGDVVVGPRAFTGAEAAEVEGFATFAAELAPGAAWDDVEIQYRSAPGGVAGRVQCLAPGRVRVNFARPAASVNPGQGLAVYRGERLLGGGWIEQVQRAPRPALAV